MITQINDEQELVGAQTRFGNSIPIWDDGFGKLWIHMDSMGITGICRAMTWEDAYEIAEDEFMQRATWDEVKADFPELSEDEILEDACFNESYGMSPNNGLYHKDLNGDRLELLTDELAKELEITVQVQDIR
jgi:hypothetical protein